MKCTKCGRTFGPDDKAVAVICCEVMGDEYIDSWFLCPQCGHYSKEVYHDRFLDEESISVAGPFGREEGDKVVEMIRQCPCPTDKKCACPTHRALF